MIFQSLPCQPRQVLRLSDCLEQLLLVRVLVHVELVPDLVRILDEPHAGVVQSDVEQFDEFFDETQNFVAEHLKLGK